MRKQYERICACCGKHYEYCSHCDDFKNQPTWKYVWDNANCKDVFMVVTDYLAKEISKDEAKERLAKCDLSKKEEFIDRVQEVIAEIMVGEVQKVKRKISE